LAIGVLGAGQAQALVVTVNGQQWNVTTFTGSYDANISKFNTPANGGVMPWWGGNALSGTFATAVNSAFGFPNFPDFSGTVLGIGPFFSSVESGGSINGSAWRKVNGGVSASSCPPGGPGVRECLAGFGPRASSSSFLFAQASLVPVPGPLPLFGAAAAFGFSRKLWKRINDSKAVGSSFPAA
jgi:hypothetical protein